METCRLGGAKKTPADEYEKVETASWSNRGARIFLEGGLRVDEAEIDGC